jgi:hypothetical protein
VILDHVCVVLDKKCDVVAIGDGRFLGDHRLFYLVTLDSAAWVDAEHPARQALYLPKHGMSLILTPHWFVRAEVIPRIPCT